MPDAYLDAAAIRAATLIRHVEIHETLGSTNDRAAKLARETAIDLPALIVARHQTAGRGRGNNKWLSSDGALTFSVLLEPAALGIGTSDWPQLSLATAVAVCDTISKELNPQATIPNPRSPRLAIKWPNDVMLDGAKLAGILIESPGGLAKSRVIIGIGINVNNSSNLAPIESTYLTSAICDFTHRRHDLLSILIGVLNAIAERMYQLRAHERKLVDAWQTLDFSAGRNGTVSQDATRLSGKCLEIAPDGALVLETPAGRQKVYSGSLRLE